MRQFLFALLCLVLTQQLYGQLSDEGTYHFGFKAGVSRSGITNVKETIIRPVFPESTFNTYNENNYGAVAGMFFYYRFPDAFLALQPEILFAQGGTRFGYQDIQDLNYQMNFEYQYVQVAVLLKVYPLVDYSDVFGGFNIFLGPQFNANVASARIMYKSNAEVVGQDLQIQQNLRQVLKGSSVFSLTGGVGFETGRFSLEARYNLGLNDAIQTMANGYNFIENENLNTSIQLTIGYGIPFDQF